MFSLCDVGQCCLLRLALLCSICQILVKESQCSFKNKNTDFPSHSQGPNSYMHEIEADVDLLKEILHFNVVPCLTLFTRIL